MRSKRDESDIQKFYSKIPHPGDGECFMAPYELACRKVLDSGDDDAPSDERVEAET